MNQAANIVFLFSGQGSHYRDMGKELYVNNATFRKSIQQSDILIYQNTSISLVEELYQYNDEAFDSVLITHPAIVAIEIAMLEVMQEMGVVPKAVAGVSLGEFAAGVAAGVWTKEEAIIASIEQAKVIIQNVDEGGMTVVLSSKNQSILDYMDKKELYHDCTNFKGCFTVSGPRNELDKFDDFLGEKGIFYQRLNVEFPFHSPMMDTAGLFCNHDNIETTSNSNRKVIMYSAYLQNRVEDKVHGNYFWDVVAKPFNIPSMIHQIEFDLGNVLYLDLGPSSTMANYIKYILGIKPGEKNKSIPMQFLSQHHNAVQKLEQLETAMLQF